MATSSMPQTQRSNLVIVRAEAAKAIKERREMRRHLSPFIKKTFQTVDPGAVYRHNWHIDLLSEHLEALYYGEIMNLIVNMSPRHLKSIGGSVALHAWILGKKPSEQIVAASYSSNLSKKHSVDCRLVVESEWYKQVFPEVVLSSDQNEKVKFVTTKRGHRIATSVGGSATGEGGNYLSLDDPINPDEAKSDTERETANDWINQTWMSRKNDPNTAKELLIMQRLHVMDPTGMLLEKYPGKYTHLVIPMEAEKKTIIIFPRSKKRMVRKEGHLMQPERTGPKKIAEYKRDPYVWSGQYQQTPTPAGGGRISLDWFPRYKEIPKQEEVQSTIFSLDTAQKEKEINDPSVLEVYQLINEQWILRHFWKDRVRYPILKKKVVEMIEFWNPDTILIEDKSSGSSLIQDLKDEPNKHYPVVAIEPEASKIIRMDSQTTSLEAGILKLPDPKLDLPWLSYLETCLMHFPKPPSWDEIDAMSQFLKYIRATDKIYDVAPHSMTRTSNWR